jgi:hypothetical protein
MKLRFLQEIERKTVQVIIVASMKMTAFWNIALCSLVEVIFLMDGGSTHL